MYFLSFNSENALPNTNFQKSSHTKYMQYDDIFIADTLHMHEIVLHFWLHSQRLGIGWPIFLRSCIAAIYIYINTRI